MKYLVTSALPYANGPLHFGHLAGVYLPADVFVRHLRLLGKEAIHISGSDEHGVAIMLNAQKDKKSYKEYVDYWHKDHKALFDSFQVKFDFFGQTSAQYHAEEVLPWFHKLNDEGYIETKDSQQLQCQDCKNHLPDRFVKGKCYSCGYEDARGDECPNCGIIIDPIRLIGPVCQICQSKNIKQVTVAQYYLLLSKCHSEYRKWFQSKKDDWRKTVGPYVESLTEEGLKDRAISRDLDWGIDVPLPEALGKKFYVWFDAPIGYVSNTKQWIKETKRKDDYIKDWWGNKDTKIYHFIGKDNIIFHCIIFPVMAMASKRINPPYDVPANQYLNLMGKQFSKSSGWYVDAKDAISTFGSDALRYYLLSILPETADSSFTWEGFQARVNNELANNIGNLVSRCLKFLIKNFPEGVGPSLYSDYPQSESAKRFESGRKEIEGHLEKVELRRSLELVMALGHATNTYFSDQAPWAQIKENKDLGGKTLAHTAIQICHLGVLLYPFLPELGTKMVELFGLKTDSETFLNIYRNGTSALMEYFKEKLVIQADPGILVKKIEDAKIAELVETLNAKKSN